MLSFDERDLGFDRPRVRVLRRVGDIDGRSSAVADDRMGMDCEKYRRCNA